MASGAARKTRPINYAELHSGDHMTRAEFHRIYQQMPEDFKAELIGGIVYVASPLKRPHGTNHPYLSAVVTAYAGNTAGVEVGDNATILLGEDGEPQPDLFLRILEDYGGRSHATKDEYIEGPPEWIAEVAHSSKAIDLNLKKLDYQRNHVQEYVVMSLKERKLRWFDLSADKELKPDLDGIYRMQAFPGLWIHGKALFAKNYHVLMNTLHEGMGSGEYVAFVKKLADQYSGKKKKRATKPGSP
jgi:Uma2 family endonuclease